MKILSQLRSFAFHWNIAREREISEATFQLLTARKITWKLFCKQNSMLALCSFSLSRIQMTFSFNAFSLFMLFACLNIIYCAHFFTVFALFTSRWRSTLLHLCNLNLLKYWNLISETEQWLWNLIQEKSFSINRHSSLLLQVKSDARSAQITTDEYSRMVNREKASEQSL